MKIAETSPERGWSGRQQRRQTGLETADWIRDGAYNRNKTMQQPKRERQEERKTGTLRAGGGSMIEEVPNRGGGRRFEEKEDRSELSKHCKLSRHLPVSISLPY